MILAFTFYTNHLKAPNLGDCKVNHLHLPIYQNISFFHEYPNFDQILYFMWLWHTRVWQGSFSCGFLIDNLSLTLHISPTPPTFISNHTPYTTPPTPFCPTSPSWGDMAPQSFFLQIVEGMDAPPRREGGVPRPAPPAKMIRSAGKWRCKKKVTFSNLSKRGK